MSGQAGRRAHILAAAALLSAMLGMAHGADKADDGGFLKPRDEILTGVKTIGVLPLAVDGVVPDAERVADRYESEVVARLEKAGFAVVKPAAMRAIRERLKQTLGGVYDPVTGRPEMDKLRSLQEYAFNEYLATQKVDATLGISIVKRRAQTGHSSAKWDGVRERLTGRSGVGGMIADALSPVEFVGTLRALSLGVTLRDTYGTALYERYGGLQLLEYVPLPAVHGKTLPGEPKTILADPARDDRALALALDPLTLGTASVAAATVQLAAVERRDDSQPLRIPLPKFRKRYHTIALAPLELPEIAKRANAQSQLHELLARRLHQLGFVVTGEESYGELWAAEVTAAGGFYDRYTGKLDRERVAGARRRVFAALKERFGIDAVLWPSVELRTASFKYLEANWDGAHESLASGSGFLDPNGDYVGTLPALSLAVHITNAEDETVYEDIGGIQVAARLDHSYVVDMPEARLLTDEGRNATAVNLALQALVPPAH